MNPCNQPENNNCNPNNNPYNSYLTPCNIIRHTEIIFENMAVSIVPPHMPFQAPLIITLTLDFGNGSITTATYQVIGDNKPDTTLYMQGGGGITIQGDGRVFTGSSKLNGNIFYSSEPQRLVSQYNGPVQITQKSSKIASLVATLAAIGQGPLNGYKLKASLNGEGTITTVCGIKTIKFPTSSLKLAIILPA